MKMWIEHFKSVATKRIAAAVLAVVVVGSVATLTFTKSAKAAPAATPAAAGWGWGAFMTTRAAVGALIGAGLGFVAAR